MTDDDLLPWAERIADGAPMDDLDVDGTPRGVRRLAMVARGLRESGTPPPGGTEPLFTWGPLHVLRPLAEGAFGEVYAAWDPKLQREVALKLRRHAEHEDAARWLAEARRLARVRHPNVLTVQGADVHDGRAGLWTDLVHGRTLEDVLTQGARWGAREAVVAGLELCAALAAVHAAGLVHGDVTTRNVMIEEGALSASPGRLVLMDFGSAHESALAQTAGHGSSAGTPLALAPEVLRGEPPTRAADVYALGVLLYRMLTGRYPVEAGTLDELRQRHTRGERTPLRSRRPDLPPGIVRAIERATEPDPARRLASAAAFESMLGESMAHPAAGRAWIVPSVTAVLALVVTAALLLRGHRDEHASTPRETTPTSGIDVSKAARSTDGGASAVTDPEAARFVGPTQPVAAPRKAVDSHSGLTPPPRIPVAVPAGDHEAARLRVDVRWYRVHGDATQPLDDGGRVEPGDRLYLEYRCDESAYVYVLNEDESGQVYALFPLSGSDLTNPLRGSESLRLPGRAGEKPMTWQVTSARGREIFLVLASRRPLAALERLLADIEPSRPGHDVELPDLSRRLPADLRGVGRVDTRALPARPATRARLRGVLEHTVRAEDDGDVWGELIEVENPAR